ncbi:MFS transporter [Corynebacterium yudongzhengii]|nr:aromatic acid/H+ symport family MFS transporter [Corynebacterium yudongzhengii]
MPEGSCRILGISGRRLYAVLLGWFFIVFDGYDLIVYGTVQSELMEEWNLTSASAGTIGSMAFVGMVIGAVGIGRLSDRIGRKTAVIGSVVILSMFTVLCGLATSAVTFGLYRLIAGIGLGGLVPSVNALCADLVPARKMAAWSTVIMAGVPLGGSIAAILAGFIVPSHEDWGWRMMFLIALVPLAVGLPLAMRIIPADKEIIDDLRHRGQRMPEGSAVQKQPGFGALFAPQYRSATVMFAIATFVTLLAWYGLGTWLPRLMQEQGYNLGASLNFTLALNLGAIIGSVVAIYAILVLAGVGTHGTQILIIAAVTQFYPHQLRGTGLGWALGVGRIGAVVAPQMAGLLLAWGLGPASSYLMFGIAAILSGLSLFVLWRIARARPPVLTRVD